MKRTVVTLAIGVFGIATLTSTLLGSPAGAHLLAPRAAAPRQDATPRQLAVTARQVAIKDTAYVHQSRSNGNTRSEAGRAQGTLPGSVHGTITANGVRMSFVFTFQVSGGTLTGHGTGKVHVGENGTASFKASMVIDHGTGKYRHVSGSGNAYGSENRLTHSATVQLIGGIHY